MPKLCPHSGSSGLPQTLSQSFPSPVLYAAPAFLGLAGALHAHALLWVRGLDPATLQRCIDDPAAVRAVSERLDAIVSQHVDPVVVEQCEASVSDRHDLYGAKGIDGATARAAAIPVVAAPNALAAADPCGCPPVRTHVAPPPAILGMNWRQHLAPLPPGNHGGSSAALQLSAEQYDAYLTYIILAVGIHSHSATCRKGGRGDTCCRLAYAAPCWNTLPVPVELLRSNDGTVYAMRALTPHAVANPPAHNPFFPLARSDSRVVTWELFRPSPGVSRQQAAVELDEYLSRCKDKVAEMDDMDVGIQEDLALIRAAMDAAGSDPAARDAAAEACVQDLFPVIGGPDDADTMDGAMDGDNDAGTCAQVAQPHASDSITFAECEQGPNQWVVPHSRVISACVKCNTSVNLLLNQDAARCASFYLAK